MCNDKRPLIAIPMGDPAGIGPEIVLKALANPEIAAFARCVVIGDKDVLQVFLRDTHSAKRGIKHLLNILVKAGRIKQHVACGSL